MRPPKQKQPQVKKGLCRVLEHVDVDVDVLPSLGWIQFFFSLNYTYSGLKSWIKTYIQKIYTKASL